MQIARDSYVKKLASLRMNGFVKIITGLRRSGKSYLLDTLYRQWLHSQGVSDAQILTVSLDLLSNLPLRNPLRLAEHVRRFAAARSSPAYVFIDEIQMSNEVPDPYDPDGARITFFDALNDLRSVPELDIYVTGSNSRMLSSDILTGFRGRSMEIRMHPLTFSEYYHALGGPRSDVFERYAFFGGMPELLSLPDDATRTQYLQNLFSKVYLRDIVERGHIKREGVLSELVDVLCSAVGSLTNPTRIADTVKSKQNEKVSANTVRSYLKQLEDAFLFSESKRFDVRGRAYFDYPSKYYAEDVGLRNARLNFRQQDPGHIMENIIYNDLRARELSVDVGVVYAGGKDSEGNRKRFPTEIDFVTSGGDRKTYIQSAYAIETPEKLESETRPFRCTNDSFPKILVQREGGKRWYDERGVLHIGIIDFLLDPSVV